MIWPRCYFGEACPRSFHELLSDRGPDGILVGTRFVGLAWWTSR